MFILSRWKSFTRWDVHDPDVPPRQRRSLKVDAPEVHWFSTSDGAQLRLTRYQGGSKGPVMLVHCIGVSSLMYSMDTVETNLLEYLFAEGYDVWLLDFRLSIELPDSLAQATLDDVATKDYPAAAAKVRELAGVESIQVVAHGVGSSTFAMAMLSGMQGVRSAVCSQVSTHLIPPTINRLKTGVCISGALARAGLKSVTAYVDRRAGWADRLYDWSLVMYPIASEERCDSPVCRRITSLYGHLYEHDKLGQPTHHVLHEMFGTVNMRSLQQLGSITRKRHLVDAAGDEAYLPNLDRMAIPIAFIHGGENECVLPKSTQITLDVLSKRNGAGLYKRHIIPDYGHVDCIIGENASIDVFPFILQHLDETAA